MTVSRCGDNSVRFLPNFDHVLRKKNKENQAGPSTQANPAKKMKSETATTPDDQDNFHDGQE